MPFAAWVSQDTGTSSPFSGRIGQSTGESAALIAPYALR